MKISASEPLEALLARERAVLGCAILDISGQQASILDAAVHADDFISSLHAAVFNAIHALVGRKELPLDYNGVCAEMIAQGTFQQYAQGYTLVSSLGEGIALATPMRRRVELLKRATVAYKAGKAALGA
jgi:replicative DNA helicase